MWNKKVQKEKGHPSPFEFSTPTSPDGRNSADFTGDIASIPSDRYECVLHAVRREERWIFKEENNVVFLESIFLSLLLRRALE